ncbi:APC family permease [Saliterribacillus persicus]|uniref:Uncharacterized protein n=1 Tax=Saliterribacillus persicus TaxID=930114 RepID=A0A368XVI2_9BACI|nr:APC family permease [Saliterribacillus persicus]RCW71905.1 hypothetical protein DFR57_10588 [Saliterribacillus persicus]
MIGSLITTAITSILYLLCFVVIVLITKKGKNRAMRLGSIILVIGFVLSGLLIYLIMPAITVPNMILANVIHAFIFISLLFLSLNGGKKVETRVTRPVVLILSLTVLAVPVFLIIGVATLDESYNSIKKQEMEVAEPLTKDETPITVSPEFARNKIQKAMSVVPNTQFYDSGKLQVQKIGDDIVFVAPVEFADFWKYLRGDTTAGYFTISATNTNAQPNFNESEMLYTNSSYFNKNIKRVIYDQYPHYIQSGDAQIEVDEDGKPWYVQTVYRPLHVTNKPDLSDLKVVVIDPEASDMTMYNVEEAPDFIEGSISSEMATTENNYFGKYINGWLNSVFGKRDVKIPNESGSESGVTPIFDESGEMYYFTDMTSPKENIDSALGYTLINSRTGELTYYNGEINNAIMDSEGANQIVNKEFPEKNWEGYMPVLYNIDGHPTWVVNVLDPNGLFKHYAYIKANDSDFVVFGDTANETLDAYRMALLQNPGNISATGYTQTTEASGTIQRVLVTSTDEGQIVQYLLEEDSTIYVVNASKAPYAIFLQSGDEIQAQVQLLENGTATVESISIEGITN